jgi:hypothetical protein
VALHRLSAPKRALIYFGALVVGGGGAQLLGANPPAPFAWGLGAAYVVAATFNGVDLWVSREPGRRARAALARWILFTAGLACLFLATEVWLPDRLLRDVLLVLGAAACGTFAFLPGSHEKQRASGREERVT